MKSSFESSQLEIRRIKHVCQLYQLALDKMLLFSSAGSSQKKPGGMAVIFAPFLIHPGETADISILWPLSFCFL